MPDVITTEDTDPSRSGQLGQDLYLAVEVASPTGTRSVSLWGAASAEPGLDVWPLFNLFAPRLAEIPGLPARPGSVMTVLDVAGLTGAEFRAILDQMGVEDRPEPGLFLHLTTARDSGYRVVELWDSQEHFEAFMERRLVPATQALQIDRATDITYWPIRRLEAPRLSELPALVPSLPGGPGTFT